VNHPGNWDRKDYVCQIKSKLNHRCLSVIQFEMGDQGRKQDVVHTEESSNHEKHQGEEHQRFVLVFHTVIILLNIFIV